MWNDFRKHYQYFNRVSPIKTFSFTRVYSIVMEYSSVSFSFKKRIIARIVTSVQYYLKVREYKRAEYGLITLLNIVGYLSSEIIGVLFIFLVFALIFIFRFFTYIWEIFILQIITLLQHILIIWGLERPKTLKYTIFSSCSFLWYFFKNYLLDQELLLCAFHEKNDIAIKQLVLRLEDSCNGASSNMIRCLIFTGIPQIIRKIIIIS